MSIKKNNYIYQGECLIPTSSKTILIPKFPQKGMHARQDANNDYNNVHLNQLYTDAGSGWTECCVQ